MDLRKEMVIIDDKIVTNDIKSCHYKNGKYEVIFKSCDRVYHYSKERLKLLDDPTLLDSINYSFYYNDILIKNVKDVYEFDDDEIYYHIIFSDNKCRDFFGTDIKIVNKENSDNVIKYMNQISKIISLDTYDGKKLLCEQMKKIKVDSLDIALANYLKLSSDLKKEDDIDVLIFPFGCNSSQYEAVSNAIHNKISVIEGPPGTGKTQTILNIIANIIIRNMNCQVVSNNNYAIENIDEKLKSYNLDFIAALLGKRKNKETFIESQKIDIPAFDEYKNKNIDEIIYNLKEKEGNVRKFYYYKKVHANLIQKRNELKIEYEYFKNTIKSQKVKLIELKRCNKARLRLLWNEMISLDKVTICNKIKYVFLYKIGNFKFYGNELNEILKTLENLIYLNDLDDLNEEIEEKEVFINANKRTENKFIKLSMDYLKKYLSINYNKKRKVYTETEIWKECSSFANDYPVILSTTHSSRNTFNVNFKFDYVIMDESSQIDVATGLLALSSARYATIIGDEKQLPNVIPDNIKTNVDKIFNEYNLDKSYSYSLNSFLSSVKETIPNVKKKMLVEHYRCHPKIINFCNKKFYNNELVIMTEDKNEKDVIKVIRTNKGNHERDKASQRQVDIIHDIVKNIKNDVGIIAPYNNQVDLIKNEINTVEVSTVHKFQGREKDTIIISTVDDDISDFVGNANILNVAISRAKRHLYFIVTGNNIKNSNINDFINYVDYNNMEIVNSKITSAFDLLYKQNELERIKFFKKHNRILKYDSENIIYYLIKDILKGYDNLEFHFHQSLNDLIIDKSLLTAKEKKYATHHNTHIDFYIFNKFGNRPVLAIEVDGYKNHKVGTEQHNRDLLKNSILKKYNIPLVRLKTNGSNEEKKIRSKLDEIMNL